MPPRSGTPGPRRSELEREADLVFLMGLLAHGGRPAPRLPEIIEVFNAHRARLAHQRALATGATEEEAQAVAEEARLSPQMVRHDVRTATHRLREGSGAISAVFLDDQIAEVRAEIAHTRDLDDKLMDEIERSHQVEWRKVTGSPSGNGHGRDLKTAPPDDETQVVLYRRNDAPAPAGLYRALQENIKARERLRQELRALKLGRLWFPTATEERTFAQAITDLDDPKKARKAALRLYTREIQALQQAEAMAPAIAGGPEVARLERMRAERQRERLKNLRHFLDLKPADGEGEGGVWELRIVEDEGEDREEADDARDEN